MTDQVAITRRDVEVSGGTLACFRLGGASDSPMAVAVHGITSNSRAWVAVARVLGERVALIAPDIRGRARSNELPGPYGVATHVDDLLAVLDAFGLERPVLVGHSLGAYVVARFAVSHPDRVHALVMVDGGLPIPGTEDVDLHKFLDDFLGPALARLKMRFPDAEAYREWWRAHPAIAGSDVADEDLVAYADHDLIGAAPELRSSVLDDAVRADAGEVGPGTHAARQLATAATLMCAPRGLLNDPNPMQPIALVEAWAAADPPRRSAILVPDVNHYTITLGTTGAQAVADAIARAV
jgi:pimeloyl-ACP methyl ester carboxylesterase